MSPCTLHPLLQTTARCTDSSSLGACNVCQGRTTLPVIEEAKLAAGDGMADGYRILSPGSSGKFQRHSFSFGFTTKCRKFFQHQTFLHSEWRVARDCACVCTNFSMTAAVPRMSERPLISGRRQWASSHTVRWLSLPSNSLAFCASRDELECFRNGCASIGKHANSQCP